MATNARAGARLLADALESAGFEYAVGGAVALAYHAIPRDTLDVDITVFTEPNRLDAVLTTFENAGCVVDRADAHARLGREECVVVRLNGMRVDIFFPDIDLYESARIRRTSVQLEGRPADIWSREDLMLFKLLFFRPKDRIDIERSLVFGGPAVERDYVRDWLVSMVGDDDARTTYWDDLTRRLP